ncbi:GntP family permease [Pelosinus sp. IPA-1]|uniref:GntP family permease n=1 Tax=Pelosinus sp. IPA-1 TaxID=3029569 RepID=UPI0024362B21|nr:GntP family permease [Pelosinus sp. IPA-1]GMA98448.1 transporter [Pelosinus sp. IPA-1]
MEITMIILSLVLLMFFAYRGYSIIFFAPIFAIIASIGGDYAFMPVYSEIYMTKVAEYIKVYYPVFLLGAVFAKIMEDGGLATAVAAKIVSSLGKERAILAVLLGCGALTYGGLSVFVVAFVMYPFSAILFRQAGIPKRLLPATLWMGIFTYAMIALPGTPQIQNVIPTAFFGTTTWAGVVTGLIGSIAYFVLGWAWISYRHKRLAAKGETYGSHTVNEPEPILENLPHWAISAFPLVVVVGVNLFMSNPFHWSWAYHWNTGSLEPLKPLKLSLLSPSVDRIQSIWSINIALVIGSLSGIVIGRKRLTASGGIIKPINSGAYSSVMAILNTASGYAFGSVITSLTGFVIIKNALLHLNIGEGPLFSAIITTNIMTAITGSASGGLTIALGMLGNEWLSWAQSIGMQPEILHRIICLASEGIDTVPHSGALVTLIAVCGLTHKESYYDVFMLTLMKPAVAFICLWIYSLTGLA